MKNLPGLINEAECIVSKGKKIGKKRINNSRSDILIKLNECSQLGLDAGPQTQNILDILNGNN